MSPLEGFEAGEEVRVRLLSPVDKLKNTVVVIGSHDPLLDELGDMLHVANNDVYMSSSHVGSMGGIMAIRRGEAHAAGCHLLNTVDGTYNVSFMKKYFAKGCLSHSTAGIRKGTLIINLPGSKKASRENILAVIDAVDHGLEMLASAGSANCGG